MKPDDLIRKLLFDYVMGALVITLFTLWAVYIVISFYHYLFG